MAELTLDLIQLNKALESLNNGLKFQEKVKNIADPQFLLAAEDSIVKRFEYTYESFWKFLKKYSESILHMENLNSPKKVFLACIKANVCTLQEGSIFIDMADSRNETSHKYSIENSRAVLSEVSRYYTHMIIVTKRINDSFENKI